MATKKKKMPVEGLIGLTLGRLQNFNQSKKPIKSFLEEKAKRH